MVDLTFIVVVGGLLCICARPRLSGNRSGLAGEALVTSAGWVQLGALLVLVALSTRFLGAYMAKVYGDGVDKRPGDRFFLPVERLIYRAARFNPRAEQRWSTYAPSVPAFSLLSILFLYALLKEATRASELAETRT